MMCPERMLSYESQIQSRRTDMSSTLTLGEYEDEAKLRMKVTVVGAGGGL